MNGALRCLIADDEPLARKLLRSMLAAYDDLEVVAECANGVEALAAFESAQPDVAFIDIQMPGLDGLELIDNATRTLARLPAIVFVTAYDQYAIRAFQVNALDYLLKPFDEDRLSLTIDRIRQRGSGTGTPLDATRIITVLEQLQRAHTPPTRLVVRTGERVHLLPVDEIHWIEADGKHVRIHTAKEAFVMRESLTQLTSNLDPRHFLRVSRAAVVNLSAVKEIHPWFRGEHMLILRGGQKIPSTRSYRNGLAEILERGAV